MSLIIEQQTAGNFILTLDGDNPISSEQNRLTTNGNFCNFKTANGANLILRQNILFSDITIVGQGVPTSIADLWVKLKAVGFFDWQLNSGSGSVGVTKLTELDDTFTSYLGRDGQLLIVNESEQKIETVAYRIFTQLLEDKLNGIQLGAQVNVNANWNSTDPNDKSTILNKPTFAGGFNQIYNELFTLEVVTQEFELEPNVVVLGVQLNGGAFVKKELYTVDNDVLTYLETLQLNDELTIIGFKF